jgi:hypothetical protein
VASPTLLVAVVVATYVPVLLARYGFSDDYMILYDFQRDVGEIKKIELADGRPGMFALHYLGSLMIHDVGALRWYRLIAVLGIAAVAVVVMRLAQGSGRSTGSAWAMGLAVAVLPSAQIMAAWSILWVAPLAGLLGMAAAVQAERGRLVLALSALILSLLIYQPGAMFYWVPLAIWLTGPTDWSLDRRRVVRHGLTLGGGAAAAVLAWLLGRGMRVPAPGDPAGGRSHLSHDPLGELHWFLAQVLPRAVTVNPARLHPMASAIVIVLILVGVVLAERHRPLRILALGGLVLASYAPSFAVQGDWPTARSMAALVPVLVVVAFRACDGFASLLPESVARRGHIVAVVVACLLAVSAAFGVQSYFASPGQRELRLVEGAVSAAHVRPGDDIDVTGGAWYHYLAPDISLDEFGNLSIKNPAVPPRLVHLVRHEQSGSWAGGVRLVDRPGPGVLDLDAAVAGAPQP